MARIEFWGGVGVIGSSKVLIHDGGHRVLLDLGLDIPRGGDLFRGPAALPPGRELSARLRVGAAPAIAGLYDPAAPDPGDPLGERPSLPPSSSATRTSTTSAWPGSCGLEGTTLSFDEHRPVRTEADVARAYAAALDGRPDLMLQAVYPRDIERVRAFTAIAAGAGRTSCGSTFRSARPAPCCTPTASRSARSIPAGRCTPTGWSSAACRCGPSAAPATPPRTTCTRCSTASARRSRSRSTPAARTGCTRSAGRPGWW